MTTCDCAEFEHRVVKNYGFIFVGCTLCLITLVPYSIQSYFFYPWLSYHTDRSWLFWIGPLNICTVFIWINYYLAGKTSPIFVTLSYKPLENNNSSKTKNKKVSKKPRWCKECLCYKAPRSHHCSICNKCITRTFS